MAQSVSGYNFFVAMAEANTSWTKGKPAISLKPIAPDPLIANVNGSWVYLRNSINLSNAF